jgi:hypothetical protein
VHQLVAAAINLPRPTPQHKYIDHVKDGFTHRGNNEVRPENSNCC